MTRDARRFHLWLGAVVALALVLRVVYVLVEKRDQVAWGDAFYYHYQAHYLVDGKGFIVPAQYRFNNVVRAAADHPPLFTLFLAFWIFLGLESFLTHKFICAALGSVTVGVMGLLGRKVAGDRVGILAALITALYPHFWANDGLVMSETMTQLMVALALLAAYRFWESPTLGRAAVVGALCGLGGLAHPDVILLGPLVVVPLALFSKKLDWRGRITTVGVAGVIAAAVISPWIIRNLTAFEEPVLLSTGLDITSAVSNCPETYNGYFKGYWFIGCITRETPPPGDQSIEALYWRKLAREYREAHSDELPGVVAARIGRAWNLYRPIQMTHLDVIEGRELWVNRLGLGTYYLFAGFAIAGGFVLRRRRVPVFPLVSLVILVTIAVAITFGNTRYRAPAEPSIALLAAVGIDAAVGAARRRRTDPDADAGVRDPGEAPVDAHGERTPAVSGVAPGG